jgi:hypothetical protein
MDIINQSNSDARPASNGGLNRRAVLMTAAVAASAAAAERVNDSGTPVVIRLVSKRV